MDKEQNLPTPLKCNKCEHDLCPTCTNCHNLNCLYSEEPLKNCYDILVPKKCKKCEKVIEEDYQKVGIENCHECDKENWITDPKEIIDTLNKDSSFKIGYKSPYQNE